jgi:YidC/Oxa1 family membrane protein insertase
MNKKVKYALGIAGVVVCASVLSSCNSFCSTNDLNNYRYAYDSLNMRFFANENDVKDYVLKTFSQQTNYDSEKTASFANVKKLSADGKTYEACDDSIFGTFNNLTYLKPNTYRFEGMSTVKNDDGVYGNIDYEFGLNSFTKSVITTAKTNGIYIPSYTYFEKFDLKVLETFFDGESNFSWLNGITVENMTADQLYGYTYTDYKSYVNMEDGEEKTALLNKMLGESEPTSTSTTLGRNYSVNTLLGYKKFDGTTTNEKNETVAAPYQKIEAINTKLVADGVIKADEAMSTNYLSLYEQTLETKVSAIRTCIASNDGLYGHTTEDLLNDTVFIEGKGEDFWAGWGEAFSHGPLEGLLVYPIGILTDNLAHAFGMNGWGQIWAIIVVTLIVRLLFQVVTLPSTISQQKQQYLQPKLAKLQEKYPNSNTNNYEKQKMAQEQMALYKKYKVHPFLPLLLMVVQFPLFICVWNALQGVAALSIDAVLGLRLSDTIWNVLSNFSGWPGNPGWWTALVLIILMSAAQVFAMLVPQWLNKKKMKQVSRTGVNPTQNEQTKTMKWVQWGMIIFTIILGFSLPSAMGVYWFIGAIISILTSVIMHLIFSKKKDLN